MPNKVGLQDRRDMVRVRAQEGKALRARPIKISFVCSPLVPRRSVGPFLPHAGLVLAMSLQRRRRIVIDTATYRGPDEAASWGSRQRARRDDRETCTP